MSIQPNKKIKIFGGLLAVILIAFFGYYIGTRWVLGAEGDPEARLYDQKGNESRAFSIGEEGFLDLRAYSQGMEGYREKLDIVIVVDKSGSMGEKIEGTDVTKLSRAKLFVSNFIEQIGLSDQVYLSLISFNQSNDLAPGHYQPLTHINSSGVKQRYNNTLDAWFAGGGSALNPAVQWANTELINNGRSDSTKYVIFVTDGGENGGGWINGEIFDEDWISNPNAQVQSGTTLADSIANNIKFLSIYINPHGNTNDLSIPDPQPRWVHPPIYYGNAGLMRFLAAKSNNVTNLSGMTAWNNDFTQVPSVDNKYFYLFYNQNIEELYKYIRGTSGSYLDTFIKLPQQVSFESMVSAIDKGGRTRSVSVTNISSSLYKIESDDPVPIEYVCAEGDESCRQNAVLRPDGSYWIENNYLDIRVKVKFNELGSFDLLSNYTNCETGPLQKVAEDSRVEYIHPDDGSLSDTRYFDALCVRVLETSPSIVKVSYESDPGSDLANPQAARKASFEAGDDVWIVLEISTGGAAGLADWKISDQVPNSVSGPLRYWYYHGADIVKDGQVIVSDKKVIFKGADSGDTGAYLGGLSSGKSYIKYRYKI